MSDTIINQVISGVAILLVVTIGSGLSYGQNTDQAIIVDNAEATYSPSWKTEDEGTDYWDENYLSKKTGAGNATVRWTPNLPKAGEYEIYYWLPDIGDKAALRVPFVVKHSQSNTPYHIYERVGGKWILMGTHHFDAGQNGYIEMTDRGQGGAVVTADAVKFVPASAAKEHSIEVGYLLDDIFHASVPKGWQLHTGGGTIRRDDVSAALKLDDTSRTDNVSMIKKFVPQSDKIRLQYRFKVEGKASDYISWELRDGDTTAIKIFTFNSTQDDYYRAGSDLVYESKEGQPLPLQHFRAGVYTPGKWNGVEVVADIVEQTADIYINGRLEAEGIGFGNPVNELDNFKISTGLSTTPTLLMDIVQITKGYNLFETFMADAEGVSPLKWKHDESGGIVEIVGVANSFKDKPWNVVELSDTSRQQSVKLFKKIVAGGDSLRYDFRFMMPELKEGVNIKIATSSGNQLYLKVDKRNLVVNKKEGSSTSLWNNLKANIWYDVRAEVFSSQKTANVYINNIHVAEEISLNSSDKDVSQILFSTSGPVKAKLFVDDVFVSPLQPASKVPAPEIAPPPSEMLIGPQYFDLGWREGTHNAWGYVMPFPDRKPLLGWYDEGDPEVWDWEIKWMLEHGMNMVNLLWYRGSEGIPPKNARNEKAYQGFLESKFANSINYWITWENNSFSVNGMEDFKKNMVPYFIEMMFRNPNYLKIDNQPVFGIYSTFRLKSDLGGDDQVAEALDYFENAVQQAGFSGIIFVGERRTSFDDFEYLSEAGYEYEYAYTWHSEGRDSAIIARQKEKLRAQKQATDGNLIPTISVGWEPPSNPTSHLSPESFKQLLLWAKNDFMPSLPEHSLGQRMLLLDNWNEYNEGHWIAPTEGHGFRHIDGVRDVFYEGSKKHKDITPEDIGLGSYNILFSKGWK